jgi:hypothetical protein
VRTTAPMPLRSGYAVSLFNSNGPMLLFFRPDRQNANILNKGEPPKTAFPGMDPPEVFGILTARLVISPGSILAHSASGFQGKGDTPPISDSAVRREELRRSGFDGVAAFPIVTFGRGDRQAHFLGYRARQEAADRVRLPAGRLHEFLRSDAAGLLQQAQDLGGLAPIPGTAGFRAAFGRLLSRGGLLARLGLRRRNLRATFAQGGASYWASCRYEPRPEPFPAYP